MEINTERRKELCFPQIPPTLCLEGKKVKWCGSNMLSFYFCCYVYFLSLNYKEIKDKAVQLRDVRTGVSDTKWISLSIVNQTY